MRYTIYYTAQNSSDMGQMKYTRLQTSLVLIELHTIILVETVKTFAKQHSGAMWYLL